MVVDQTVAAQAGLASSLESGTKLYISNLDYGVSNDDLKVIIVPSLFGSSSFRGRFWIAKFDFSSSCGVSNVIVDFNRSLNNVLLKIMQ